MAQQSPGSWEREQIRHRHQNLGDVDHGLTNTLHVHADRMRIRTPIAFNLNTMWPSVTRLSTRHEKMSTESRKPRCSTGEGVLGGLPCWNVTQSLVVTNGDKIDMDRPQCEAGRLTT